MPFVNQQVRRVEIIALFRCHDENPTAASDDANPQKHLSKKHPLILKNLQ
jgi:hypothetical protein